MLDPILEWCAPKGDEFGKTESREKNLRRLGEDAVSGNLLGDTGERLLCHKRINERKTKSSPQLSLL